MSEHHCIGKIDFSYEACEECAHDDYKYGCKFGENITIYSGDRISCDDFQQKEEASPKP